MPGVADAQRKTQEKQEQIKRQQDRENLLQLVKEGRLEDADAHQLETLKLALELNTLFESKQEQPAKAEIDTQALAGALKSAVAEALKENPGAAGGGSSSGSTEVNTGRPGMRHVDLAQISHKESDLKISHGDTLAKEEQSKDDGAEKRRKLKELKGRKNDRPQD